MPVVGMPDGTQVSFPDEMPPDQIKSLIAQKFPNEIKQAATPQAPQGVIQNAIEPITSLPGTYAEMNRSARERMSGGYDQAKDAVLRPVDENDEKQKAQGLVDFVKGVGSMGLGAVEYVASPINAALRTVVGKPVEAVTGLPKEATEFAASMVLPIPKRIPTLAKAESKVAPSTGELSTAATQGYKEVEAARGTFSPEITSALANNVVAKLRKEGSYEHLADPVHKTVDILRKDTPASVDEVRSVLEALSSLRIDPDSKVRRAANIATWEINQFLRRTEPEAAAALATANANYAAAARAKKIDQAEDIAGLRTGRAGYGGNAVNSMRQVMSPIVEGAIKGNPKGFSPEEIRAMRQIVEGSTATNTLRGIGQLSPSKGAIQTGIAIGSGGISAGVGAVGNKLATVLTRRQIDRLNEMVRKRSPAYEEAVNKAAEKYFTAADEFIASPSQQNLIRAVVSARALSSGLTRDGIEMPAGGLLRYLQSPAKSGADEQDVPGEPSQ